MGAAAAHAAATAGLHARANPPRMPSNRRCAAGWPAPTSRTTRGSPTRGAPSSARWCGGGGAVGAGGGAGWHSRRLLVLIPYLLPFFSPQERFKNLERELKIKQFSSEGLLRDSTDPFMVAKVGWGVGVGARWCREAQGTCWRGQGVPQRRRASAPCPTRPAGQDRRLAERHGLSAGDAGGGVGRGAGASCMDPSRQRAPARPPCQSAPAPTRAPASLPCLLLLPLPRRWSNLKLTWRRCGRRRAAASHPCGLGWGQRLALMSAALLPACLPACPPPPGDAAEPLSGSLACPHIT